MIFHPGSIPISAIAIFVLGLALGAEVDSIAYLTGRHFGLGNFATLFGAVSGLLGLMNGIGPIVANHIYDISRSYQPVLWGMIPASLLSSILFLSLKAYPDFDKRL